MALQSEWVRYGGASEYLAFLCRPARAKTPLPAIVVLQEAWGVDEHLEEVTRRFAAAGYAALAPDLYAKDGQRPAAVTRERLAELQAFVNDLPPGAFGDATIREAELARKPEAERDRIGETFGTLFGGMSSGGLRVERWLPDLLAATHFLREENEATRGQPIGSVGFCMGGALSALLACHDPALAAAIIFYGSAPPAAQIPAIRCPVLGLYGGLDALVNAGIESFAAAMKQNGKRFDHEVYSGAQHAFFNDNRPSYDVAAARDAFVRTLDLLRRTLA